MLNFKLVVGFLLVMIALALQVAGVHAAGYYNYSGYASEGYYGNGYAPIGYGGYSNGGYSNYGYSNYGYSYPIYNSYNPVRFQPLLPSNSNFYFAGTYRNPHSDFEWYAYIDNAIDYRYVPASVYSFFCGFSFC